MNEQNDNSAESIEPFDYALELYAEVSYVAEDLAYSLGDGEAPRWVHEFEDPASGIRSLQTSIDELETYANEYDLESFQKYSRYIRPLSEKMLEEHKSENRGMRERLLDQIQAVGWNEF